MHRFLFIATSCLGALAPSTFAADATHAHGAMRPPERALQAELGASAAFDRRGVLWAAHKVSGHIAVSRSEDQGRSWSNPVLVTSAPEPTDTGGDARPKIALGAKNEIYLTWTRPLAKPYTGEIRFARSLDQGRTFSPSSVVHRDRQEITHRFDTLAVNPRGQLFIAWIDKRDLPAATPTSVAELNRGAAIYFAVSDDSGASFRGDFKAVDNACECCRIALTVHEDGDVAALWRHIFPPNIRDHATAVLSADGRASLMQRASFEEWRIDACPHHGPSAALDATGNLHAVWFSAATQSRGLFYGRPRNQEVDGLRRIGGDSARHAAIAVDQKNVAIAWKAFENGRWFLRGMTSADAGTTWKEVELANVEGPTDHPLVLSREGTFFVFWNSRAAPLAVLPMP